MHKWIRDKITFDRIVFSKLIRDDIAGLKKRSIGELESADSQKYDTSVDQQGQLSKRNPFKKVAWIATQWWRAGLRKGFW
jgi:hypothetical protein